MQKMGAPIVLGLAGMVVFWALTPVAIAFVKTDFSILFQVWIRYFGSVAVLWIYLLLNRTQRESVRKYLPAIPRLLAPLALTALFTISFQLLYTYCFFLISPGFGILLYQSQILFSLLLGMLFFSSERALLKRGGTQAGIVLVIAGAAAVLAFKTGGIAAALNIGVLMAVGAAVSWSGVGITLRKSIGQNLPPLLTVTLVFTILVLLLLPVLLLTPVWVVGSPSPLKWIVLIGSGLLGIAGGQGLYYFLLPKLGLITTSSVQLAVPFVTGFFSFLVFGELIAPLQIAGGLVLLYGCRIILVQKAAQPADSSGEALPLAKKEK